MYEDDHLEADYESRNGSDVDTDDERMSAYDDADDDDIIGWEDD